MLFRRLRIWRVEKKYRKKVWSHLRPPADIVAEMKRCEREYLKADRDVKPIEKKVYYWRGRLEAIKWIFKEH